LLTESSKHFLFRKNSLDFLDSFFSFKLLFREQLGNLLLLCREIAGARDILQKFENLKKQQE
jgi:hypothetical protein